MKIQVQSWFLAIFTAAAVIAAAQSPARAQAPTTPAEFKALLGEMARTATELADEEEKHRKLEPQVTDFVKRRDQHDATPCVFPPGRPDICASYDRQANALNAERNRLFQATQSGERQLGILRSRQGLQLSRMRLGRFLGELEAWQRRVVACAERPSAISAAICLNGEWQRYP